jgi:hypothetical protein
MENSVSIVNSQFPTAIINLSQTQKINLINSKRGGNSIEIMSGKLIHKFV